MKYLILQSFSDLVLSSEQSNLLSGLAPSWLAPCKADNADNIDNFHLAKLIFLLVYFSALYYYFSYCFSRMTYDIIQLRSKKQDKALKITKLSSDREKAVKMATSNVHW